MSSVNNQSDAYYLSVNYPSTDPDDLYYLSTDPTIQATAAADGDDIAPATSATSSSIAKILAANASGATPVLATPDGQKVSMAAYGRAMSEMVDNFQKSILNDAQSDIQASANFYQTIISNILEIESLLDQQKNLEDNINGLMDQYAQSAAAVNTVISDFNQSANNAQDQAVYNSMQDSITKYNQAITAYNKAQTDLASGAITQDAFNQATTDFTDAQTAYNDAVTAYNDYGTQRNQSLTTLIQSYNTQAATGFGGLMDPVNAAVNQYNTYAQEAGSSTLKSPTIQQVKTSTYMWGQLPDATTTDPITPLAARPTAPTIAAALPPSAANNLDAFIGKIYDYLSGIIDALLANLQLLVEQKNYADNSDEYDNSDTTSKKSNSINPILNSSATNASSTELFASGSATYMQGASSQAFLTPFFGVSTPDFNPVIKEAIKKNNEQTSTATDTLLRAAAEQYLISAGLLGGKTAVGLLGDDVASVKPKGDASKVAVALGFTRELQKLSDSNIYSQGVSAVLSTQGADPSAASTESTQQAAASFLRFNGALLSLFQLSQALNSPDLVSNVIQLAGGSSLNAQANNNALTPDQERLREDLLAQTTQQLQPELSKTKSQKIAEMLVDALLGNGSQSIVNTLKSTITQYGQQNDTKQALSDAVNNVSSPQPDLYTLSEMLNTPGNDMLYSAKMGMIYAESGTHNHESGLQFPV